MLFGAVLMGSAGTAEQAINRALRKLGTHDDFS
jgi:hypothetical protein